MVPQEAPAAACFGIPTALKYRAYLSCWQRSFKYINRDFWNCFELFLLLRLSCVDPRSYARIWREGMHEGAIMVSVHSLTQDSRNVLNRPRTGKNPFFKFFRPDFWTDLNDCRQRLLFARQLIPRKCSLCSQGRLMVNLRISNSG